MRLTSGNLVWLKVALHLLCLLPLMYLVLLVLTDNAGGDPVQYIIHYTGMGAINALIATLLVSPLAKRFKQGLLLQTRRLLGLYVLAYAMLHLSAFISLDLLFAWELLFEEILKRPYILVGASCLVLLLVLGLTSFQRVKRNMGKRWQLLHNWVYLAAVLAPIHFYWSVKSEIIEPGIYLLIFASLLLLRRKALTKHLRLS
ncbi:protein-methionine-sulfoxide reductase heme-binding subunit MsrQ [Shewanella sp.]|uniref:protein-methionine-sulfoxide reductase heme-binding subunit MsrQ n=1 Tax=Shewanella sp. TaxID=50422 RepID=UPI0040542CC8